MKKLLLLVAICLGLKGLAQPYFPPFEYVDPNTVCTAFPLSNTSMIPIAGGANYKAYCQTDNANGDLKIKFTPNMSSPSSEYVFSHIEFRLYGVEFDPNHPNTPSSSIFNSGTGFMPGKTDPIQPELFQSKNEDYWSADQLSAYAHFNLPEYDYSYYVECRVIFKKITSPLGNSPFNGFSNPSPFEFMSLIPNPSGNGSISIGGFSYITSNTSIVNFGNLATTDFTFVNENYTTSYSIDGQSRTVPVYCENEEIKVNAGIASCSNASKFTLSRYHTDLQTIISIISYPEMPFIQPFNVVNVSDLMLGNGALLPGVYKMEFQSLPGGNVVSKYFEIKQSEIGGRVDASSLHSHTFPIGGTTIQYYGLASNSVMNVFNTSTTLCEDLYMMKVFQLDPNTGERIDCPVFCYPNNCNVGVGDAPNITLPNNTFPQDRYFEIEWSANVNGSWDIESYYFKISSSFNSGGGFTKKSGVKEDADSKNDAIDIKQENSLDIYPNPSNGELNLDFAQNIESGMYQVVNALGGSIKSGNIQNSGSLKLNLSNQSPGIYTVIITFGYNQLTKKIVIE